MTPEQIRARLLTPATREEVEAAWAEHFNALGLPSRPVIWCATPADAFEEARRRMGAEDPPWAGWLPARSGTARHWRALSRTIRQISLQSLPVPQPLKELAAANAAMNARGGGAVWACAATGLRHGLDGWITNGALAAYWTAFGDAARLLEQERKGLSASPWLCRLVIWSAVAVAWVLPDAVICLVQPTVRVDPRTRLHAEDGPAISWGPGWEFHCWHGVQVPGWVIEHPDRITADKVMRERDLEVRRVMLQRMTLERFIRQATGQMLDMDADAGGKRTLRLIDLEGDEPVMVLTVKCPSTRMDYALRVPPTMRTCRQAAAWTFGYDSPDIYSPAKET